MNKNIIYKTPSEKSDIKYATAYNYIKDAPYA